MECVCKFDMRDQLYFCDFEDVNITEPGIKLSIKGKHLDGRTNNDVTEIWIEDQNVEYMPAGLGEIFPNIKILRLLKCGLRRITKNDLIGMQNLETIYIKNNSVKYIPGDLFEYTRNLKTIIIKREIQFIEEGLIDGLKELEYLHIKGDTINICSESVKKDLTKIKAELKDLLPNITEREKYAKEGKRLEEIVEKRLNSTIKKPEGKLEAIKSLLQSGRFSDMKIIIEDETFKVHKVILGAHSSVLADIFENNEDVKELNLKEIKKETFKNILNFIYKDELPAADANYLDLYSASGQLQIVELMQICEERIKVEEGNVAQVAIAANKFGSQMLKDKAFEAVQKMFLTLKISQNLIGNLEDLNKILETFKIFKKYSSETEELKNQIN